MTAIQPGQVLHDTHAQFEFDKVSGELQVKIEDTVVLQLSIEVTLQLRDWLNERFDGAEIMEIKGTA